MTPLPPVNAVKNEHNTAAARIPECGDFAGIAQNLDWVRVQLGEVVKASSCVDKVGALDSETIRLAKLALIEMPPFPSTDWQAAAKYVCTAVSAAN